MAHRTVPPLFVTLAYGWLALGEAERALDLIDHRLESAQLFGLDEQTARLAEYAKARIIRRMRMLGRAGRLVERMGLPPSLDDQEVVLPILALMFQERASLQPAPDENSSPRELHLWWRHQSALTDERKAHAVQTLGRLRRTVASQGANERATFHALRLDLAERAILEGRGVRDESDWRSELPEPRTRSDWATRLRYAALENRRDGLGESDFRWEKAGQRLIAELALEEGELLALRLPEHGARLLEFASKNFLASGDRVGACIATIRCAIAWIHHGDDKRAKTVFDDAKAWDSPPLLRNLTINLREYAAASEVSPEWAGWAQRAASCITWLADREAWRRQQFGQGIPIELDLEPSRSALAALARPQRKLGALGKTVLGLLIVVGALLSFFWGAGHFVEELSRGIAMLVFFAVLACLLSFLFVARCSLRMRVHAAAELVSPMQMTAPISVPIILDVRRPLNLAVAIARGRSIALKDWLRLLFRGDAETSLRETVRVSGVEPYRQAAEFPEAIVTEVRALNAAFSLSLRHLRVQLEIDPTLAQFPWEALLAFAALPAGGDSLARLRFRFYRTPAGTSSPHKLSVNEVAVLSAGSWERAMLHVWQESGWLSAAGTLAGGRPGCALHLVGKAVTSTAGLRLQIDAELSPPPYERVSARREAPRTKEAALIGPDNPAIRSAALIVLQGTPAELNVRLRTDREQVSRSAPKGLSASRGEF